eukprot:6121071-Amphidinium_carterae.1
MTLKTNVLVNPQCYEAHEDQSLRDFINEDSQKSCSQSVCDLSTSNCSTAGPGGSGSETLYARYSQVDTVEEGLVIEGPGIDRMETLGGLGDEFLHISAQIETGRINGVSHKVDQILRCDGQIPAAVKMLMKVGGIKTVTEREGGHTFSASLVRGTYIVNQVKPNPRGAP